ncbi:hypothetical protein [Spongiactinospora sp. TRM90649]|uniref:hypothetical protein n=1 Tax=Spongiactinospora sp. TRM90649 TaxID=3031114 RepID=UPI0023F7077D|nr:hypothetical protein [Spongiactinospora sp. TRM90649]MDF5756651.1 hypothetical protein [Spongiactinospora sp. TRM90649]
MPGALIGVRKNGRPIYVQAGGSETVPEQGPARDAPPNEVPPVNAPEPEVVNPDAKRVDELPNWAQRLIKDTRNEAAEHRTQLSELRRQVESQPTGPSAEDLVRTAQQEVAQQIARALGLAEAEETPPDPQTVIDKLTSEKATTEQERDAERDLHRRVRVELAVHRSSTKFGADPDALLDSRSFLRNLRELDPDDAAAIDDVIKRAVEDNPKFKASQTAGPPAKSGGDFAGGTGARPEEAMTVDDFRARRRKKSEAT